MQDEPRAALEYYTLMIDHLREGGCSPHRVRALESRLKLREQTGTQAKLQEKLEELNMLHEPALAARLDELYAKERAARESGDDEFARLCAQAMDATGAVQDLNALHTATVHWDEKIREFLEAREDLLYALTGALMCWADLKSLHDADRDRVPALLGLREMCEKIEAAGFTAGGLLAHPWYRAHLTGANALPPVTDREIDGMRGWPDIDPAAVAEIRAKVADSLKDLQGRGSALVRLAAAEEARTLPREYLAIAPDDAPGPYTYVKTWEAKG
ncbi:MAG: hypothetical protein EPN93_07555 [Spirochaetes bacterium]|nr:MAG: hypothetical protein EPN93_07555 [Spirochaetota bacterium]